MLLKEDIAATQYAAGADVVYQVAIGTGAGVFNEGKIYQRNELNESDKVWVVSVVTATKR